MMSHKATKKSPAFYGVKTLNEPLADRTVAGDENLMGLARRPKNRNRHSPSPSVTEFPQRPPLRAKAETKRKENSNELVQLTLYPAALRAPGHSAADHGVERQYAAGKINMNEYLIEIRYVNAESKDQKNINRVIQMLGGPYRPTEQKMYNDLVNNKKYVVSFKNKETANGFLRKMSPAMNNVYHTVAMYPTQEQ